MKTFYSSAPDLDVLAHKFETMRREIGMAEPHRMLEPPKPLVDTTAMADAFAEALSRFANEDGALRIAETRGVRPYGGGG